MPQPLVIAHRGASGYRPEHTRAAYELAFSQGADAVEPDLVSTSDRVLVIRHENEISGTTDVAEHPEFADRRTTKVIDGDRLTGWFTEDFTWAELSSLRATERLPDIRPTGTTYSAEGILRFSDLLELLDAAPLSAAGAPIGLVAEIKHATYFESIGLPLDELLAAELEAARLPPDRRLIIESFERTVLAKLRDRGVRGSLVFLLESEGTPADEVAALGEDALPYSSYLTAEAFEELAKTLDGVSLDKHILQLTDAEGRSTGADLVSRAHAAGLTVYCWTLRAENTFLAEGLRNGTSAGRFGDWQEEFRSLMRLGLDGVFADQPDLAISVRAALAE
ncbi:MAG: glycerophosphodiester phosphodiesterase [Microbacteriaceae bacterium]|nr:glycerophosphodiester phosphodiesterase [Microbacteriaceae bacterium]